MQLAAELDALKRRAVEELPPEVLAGTRSLEDELRASGVLARVARVGETCPSIALPDLQGRPFDLAAALRLGPLVLTFARGLWCPFCRLDLAALEAARPALEGLGATLAVISPNLLRFTAAAVRSMGLRCRVLLDRGQNLAIRFGLAFLPPAYLRQAYAGNGLDLARFSDDGSWRMVIPARYVVDRSGVIRAVEADPDHTWRSDPARLHPLLRALAREA